MEYGKFKKRMNAEIHNLENHFILKNVYLSERHTRQIKRVGKTLSPNRHVAGSFMGRSERRVACFLHTNVLNTLNPSYKATTACCKVSHKESHTIACSSIPETARLISHTAAALLHNLEGENCVPCKALDE